jgi:hypothetical protein
MLSPFGGAVFTMRIVDDAEGRNDLYQGLPLHVMKHNGAMEKEGAGRAWKICAHSNGMRRNFQSPIHTTDCDPSNTSKNRVSSFSPFIML